MNITGNKISILGAVRSGVSAAKLALLKGAIPFVSDMSNSTEVVENISILKKLGINSEFGEHTEKIFDCDYIITSPGVPSDSEVIVHAKEKGIEVISEIEFASWFCEGSIIAITGTNGKTTTTSLCAHVLNSSGAKCYVAGNIGLPFSEIVLSIKPEEFIALEVSSFQLDYIKKFKPNYAVILNITPDHLDRYENKFDLYIKSKMKITENQDQGDVFIYNNKDENILIEYVSQNTLMLPFSLEKNLSNGCFVNEDNIISSVNNNIHNVCKLSDLALRGEHNIQNSLAVISIAMNIGLNPIDVKKSLGTFKGVEHRLEFVREINGISFVNDSKATNVDSVWYALRSFDEPIILVLGGKDKGNDYSKIEEEVKKRVKKIYAIGSSAQKIFDYFQNVTEVEIVDSLEKTVTEGLKKGVKGDVLLLSPACASFDMFKNYEDRGQQFKEIINGLK